MLLILGLVGAWWSALANPQRLVVVSTILHTQTEVYIYRMGNAGDPAHIVYLTDGEKLMQQGFEKKIKEICRERNLTSAYFVFVSSVDLVSQIDQRNVYFFCNEQYVEFFEQELIPATEQIIGQTFAPAHRILLGISFGGLNAAWFSAQSSAFKNYALLSPITYPCPALHAAIVFSENKDLKLFLSTGLNDAENYVQPLIKIYETKSYQLVLKETTGGHDFDNWQQQMASVLAYFFEGNLTTRSSENRE
ncbi:MAG: alpha/beta hydrolase-fold protein [Bacteroidota bacterium]